MKHLYAWIIAALLCTSSVAVSLAATPTSPEEDGDQHFDVITVGELSFKDVWVHRQTNAVILIRHSMGIHSIKLTDLPSDELEELKSQVGDLANVPEKKTGWRNSALAQKVMTLFGGSTGRTKVILGIVCGLVVLLFGVKAIGRKGESTA